MTDFARGRPLDDDEMRALQEIEAHTRAQDPDLAERLGSQPGLVHPPTRLAGTRLRPRTAAWVMALTLLYVVLLSLLPEAAILPVVVVTLAVLIPAGCLLCAAREGEL